jgi:hypothetical protein
MPYLPPAANVQRNNIAQAMMNIRRPPPQAQVQSMPTPMVSPMQAPPRMAPPPVAGAPGLPQPGLPQQGVPIPQVMPPNAPPPGMPLPNVPASPGNPLPNAPPVQLPLGAPAMPPQGPQGY